MPALILAQVEPTYIIARSIFIREDSSKMYSPWVFSLAQLVAEMPNSVLCSVFFFLLLTYPAGFYTSSDRAGYQFLIIFITEIFSVTLGQAVAALCTPFSSSCVQRAHIMINSAKHLHCRSVQPLPFGHLLHVLRCHHSET